MDRASDLDAASCGFQVPPIAKKTADAHDVRLIATVASEAPATKHDQLHLFGHRVDVPPLRRHVEDIADLAPVLLADLAADGRRPTLRPAALAALLRHDWPGNVRELRAVLAVALAAAGTDPIGLHHLPREHRQIDPGRRWSVIELAERNAILNALEAHHGNKRAAANALGLARSTLYRKLRALDIDLAS